MTTTASLPPGAKVLPLHEPAQPARRTKETYSRASPALTTLRVQHLLPESTALAHKRVQELKRLYRVPLTDLKAAHDKAMSASVQRLRLAKSVRNVKVAQHRASGPASVVGSLCMPFSACCALPPVRDTRGKELSPVVTGAVDGLITVWDTSTCAPLASSSSCEGNQWGRVRSVAAPGGDGQAGSRLLFFSTTMFDRRIGVWTLRHATDGVDGGNEEDHADAEGWVLKRLDDSASAEEGAANRHIATINQLAVDPTGNLLASASDDATLRLWDVRTGTAPLGHLCTQDGYEGAGAVLGVAFHPDGSLVSTSDAGGRIVTWDTRTGKHAFTTLTPAMKRSGGGAVGGHLDRATCVAWSPCGVRLASGSADTVIQLWDARMLYREHAPAAATGHSASAVVAPFQLLGHEDVVTSLSFYTDPFSPSASSHRQGSGLLPLALASTSLDGTVRLWDMDTGLCVRTLATGSPVYSHCRPVACASSATADHNEGGEDGVHTAAAIFTIGHTKYWSLFDISGAEAAVVTETDTLVDSRQGNMASAPAAAAGDGDDDSDEDEDEEEEDEMASLMKKKSVAATAPTQPQPPPKESSDEDDEDEMEMLKKKRRKDAD